jgi:hypothetical protein
MRHRTGISVCYKSASSRFIGWLDNRQITNLLSGRKTAAFALREGLSLEQNQRPHECPGFNLPNTPKE